jgi:hypothetical protein
LKVPSVPSPRGTWQAIFVARSDVSKDVILFAPDLDAISLDHDSSTPQASGVTSPNPVTTTRRVFTRA